MRIKMNYFLTVFSEIVKKLTGLVSLNCLRLVSVEIFIVIIDKLVYRL